MRHHLMVSLFMTILFSRASRAFISSKTSRSVRKLPLDRIIAVRLVQNRPSVDLISSEQSTTVKRIHALLTKRKKRSDLGLTVVEGPKMTFDLLRNDETRQLMQQAVVSVDKPEWTEELLDYGLLVCEGTPAVLAKCSDTITPQGIVATIRIPAEPSRNDPPSKADNPLYLVLDGVSDPGNVGTLLRSCVSVGVAGVILMPGCCDVWNPKAVRSAMGSSFHVPILSVESITEALDTLESWNVRDVFAATMECSDNTASVPHYDVSWTARPSAVIIGSEGEGLSDDVRRSVLAGDLRALHVPMEPAMESLNAAVCGSVILFEYHRQNNQI